jgi:hypothetical protein
MEFAVSGKSHGPMRVLVLDGRIGRDAEPLIGHVATYPGRSGIDSSVCGSNGSRGILGGGFVRGLVGAYGVRELFDWPESIVKAARTFGESALDRGYGHISLDFMRNRDGQFEAIEVNPGNVALWWTTQFQSFRRQYARAVHRVLVERNGASSSPASA